MKCISSMLCNRPVQSNSIALTGITKAGYLFIQIPAKTGEWRRLYFLLNGHTLTYYNHAADLASPKGDLLLTGNMKILLTSHISLQLDTGYETLSLRGNDPVDTQEWKQAIEKNAQEVASLARGYFVMVKRGRHIRRFCMLHNECITYHPSHVETTSIIGFLPLNMEMIVSAFDDNRMSIKGITKQRKPWNVTADTRKNRSNWIEALTRVIANLKTKHEKNLYFVPDPNVIPGMIHSGTLSVWHKSGVWMEAFFVLTNQSLYEFRGAKLGDVPIPIQHRISPNTIVSSMMKGSYSFQVVTFSTRLQLNASSPYERDAWISMMKGIVPATKYDEDDPVYVASRAMKYKTCSLNFGVRDSPGLVLERHGNWAIVTKVTKRLQDKVPAGSTLMSVNGKRIFVEPFETVASLLENWTPPLALKFREAPSRKGNVMIQVESDEKGSLDSNSSTPVFDQCSTTSQSVSFYWDHKVIQLTTGYLLISSGDQGILDQRRDINLSHSSVLLVLPKDKDNHRFCFRIMSGSDSIVFKALSYEDMIDWVSAITHSISLANGGGLLLDLEKTAENSSQLVTDKIAPTDTTPKGKPSPLWIGTVSTESFKSESRIVDISPRKIEFNQPNLLNRSDSFSAQSQGTQPSTPNNSTIDPTSDESVMSAFGEPLSREDSTEFIDDDNSCISAGSLSRDCSNSSFPPAGSKTLLRQMDNISLEGSGLPKARALSDSDSLTSTGEPSTALEEVVAPELSWCDITPSRPRHVPTAKIDWNPQVTHDSSEFGTFDPFDKCRTNQKSSEMYGKFPDAYIVTDSDLSP
eukprot:scaffold52641_cov48-Attheya_sp.AAC.1